ncbi:transmembrane protein 39A-like isoform X1 [Ostrea edulis]|uniref:transmembrane protein 39A-like isoform X1 n=1 Tax=Ostrea edulis TaxID=37623 RepID=UPI002095E912|nr:transmembrane protein 39A-like isoform X1 [Ostrea edulis]
MPSGRRILSRIQSNSYNNSSKGGSGSHAEDRDSTMVPLAQLAVLPKHCHLPEIPSDPNMSFEAMLYFFGVIAMGLQYINLYRTVWWLPHSHANYALNFYLIDVYLVLFLCVLMSRRIVWCFVQEVYGSRSTKSVIYWIVQVFKGALLVSIALGLVYTAYQVVANHSALYCLFLSCPVITYVFLFGPSIKPLYHKCLVWPTPVCDRPRHRREEDEVILFHNCVLTPDIIRSEVDYFKSDFNNRIKQVLFNSLLTAYYMTFVPLCFAQHVQNTCESCWNTLYYDTWWVGQHVVVTWLSAFLMLIVHYLPPKYLDLLHRTALHLGRWQKVEGRHAHVPYNAWSELTVWPQGALVKHVKGLFKADGINVTAEPGNGMHGRFYFLFHQPMRVVNWLLILTWLLVGYQFFCLLQSTEWNHIICIALVLFCNYYTLFKLLRDRIIIAKAYKEEISEDEK